MPTASHTRKVVPLGFSPTSADGEKWHELFLCLLRLNSGICDAENASKTPWRPEFPLDRPWEDAWDAWLGAQESHADAIATAVRELVHESRLSTPTPEVLYFLALRHRAVLDHLRTAFMWRGTRPVSLIPFPPFSVGEIAEWFLTDWAAEFAIDRVFSEHRVPRGGSA